MTYESVDKLQKALVANVFHYAKDSKKAAGRALGTLVEIITYYLLKTWSFNNHISIERGLEEYGNPEITHNVEYSLHPVMSSVNISISKKTKSISSNIVVKALEDAGYDLTGFERKNNY